MKRSGQCRLGLRQADARTQTRHHFDPVDILVEIPLRGLGAQQKICVHGKVKIRRDAWIDTEEFGWCDSRHRKWNVIDENGLPDCLGGPAKAPLAQAAAEDHYRL